jgi:hypothetical protein
MGHLSAIRAKLTRDEVDFLKRKFGFDLGSPELEEQIAAMAEIGSMAQKVEEIQAQAERYDRGRLLNQPECSFCGGASKAVGPLAQSRSGVSICQSCAQECISRISQERTNGA